MARGAGANGTLVSRRNEGRSRNREYRARAHLDGGADSTEVSALGCCRLHRLYQELTELPLKPTQDVLDLRAHRTGYQPPGGD